MKKVTEQFQNKITKPLSKQLNNLRRMEDLRPRADSCNANSNNYQRNINRINEDENAFLRLQNESLKEELHFLRSELEITKTERKSLELKLSDSNKKVTELDDENERMKKHYMEIIDSLQVENETLKRGYESLRAEKDAVKAKEQSIKQANKAEAQKCIQIATESIQNEDYTKAEKMYRKAAKLDFEINVDSLLDEMEKTRIKASEERKERFFADLWNEQKQQEAEKQAAARKQAKQQSDRMDNEQKYPDIWRLLDLKQTYRQGILLITYES